MTILVIGSDPIQNLTLEGTHSYTTGKYIGSISATSSTYGFLRGATFSGDTGTGALTIVY